MKKLMQMESWKTALGDLGSTKNTRYFGDIFPRGRGRGGGGGAPVI